MPDIANPEIMPVIETSQTETEPEAKKTKKRYTKADKAKISKLALENGLSCYDIAKVTGGSKSRIHEIIQEAKNSKDLTLFAENKDKVFEALQARLVSLTDDEILKKWLERRGSTDLAILQDKIQALRGQPQGLTGVEIRIILDNLPQAPIDVTPQDTTYSGEPVMALLDET